MTDILANRPSDVDAQSLSTPTIRKPWEVPSYN
jgi:hypothetical protein